MKRLLILSFFAVACGLILLSAGSCSKQSTGMTESPQLRLSVDEVGVTEAWLELEIQNLENGIVKVWRDSSEIFQTTENREIAIYDENLTPNRPYRYHAEAIVNNTVLTTTEVISITTMVTTRQDFTWQIDTLGESLFSKLNDVAIINDNNVWAVGEIHTSETDRFDSLGNWVSPFNIINLRNNHWTLTTTFEEGYGYGINNTIFVFGPENIWAGSTIPKNWINQRWIFYGSTRNYPGSFHIWKIWGNSVNELFCAGDNGGLTLFNGQNWRKIPSNTTLPIHDIWGTTNTENGDPFILAVASTSTDRELLQINGVATAKVFLPLQRPLHGIWFKSPNKIYLCGGGIFTKVDQTLIEIPAGQSAFTTRIQGTDHNNIWAVGHFGLVLHFNGSTWKEIPQLRLGNGNYNGLAVSENMAVAVGFKNDRAIIARIYRN